MSVIDGVPAYPYKDSRGPSEERNNTILLFTPDTETLLERVYWSFAARDAAEWTLSGLEVARIAEPKRTLALRVVSGSRGHRPIHEVNAGGDVVIHLLLCSIPNISASIKRIRYIKSAPIVIPPYPVEAF